MPRKPNPWERQPREGDRAFEAFAAYRDMGPERSIRKVAESFDKHHTLLGQWSSEHSWVQRVAAWDAHQDDIKRKAHEAEIIAMSKRHAQQAQILQVAATAPANEIVKRLKKNPALLARISDDQIIDLYDIAVKSGKLVDQATKMERLARGEPTGILEHGIRPVAEQARRNLQAVFGALGEEQEEDEEE